MGQDTCYESQKLSMGIVNMDNVPTLQVTAYKESTRHTRARGATGAALTYQAAALVKNFLTVINIAHISKWNTSVKKVR